MYSSKKVNSDLFLLILLLVRLGLEPDVHVNNRWHQQPESRSVFLGPTSAYTQITFHAPHSGITYPHPKSLEYNEIDEATSLFSRLNYYDTLRDRTGSLIACIANSPDRGCDDDNRSSDSSGNSFGNISLQSGTGNPLQVVNGGSTNEREATLRFDAVELSPEEMDLIEILWKQDIDLGVSRDAYDSRQCVEVEKLKEIELKKEKDLFGYPDLEVPEEPTHVPDLPDGLNYTIDSETGEYVIEEFSDLSDGEIPDVQLLKNDTKFLESELLKENETLGALSQDSYLPFDLNDEFCNLTEVFSPTQLSHLLDEDISTDSDYLSQIEDLEKELGQFGTLNDTNGDDSSTGEIYPSIEECWSDTTTMLPLLALNNPHQAAIAPLSPHSVNNYPALNSDNNLNPLTPTAQRTNESFIGMLQNVSMEVPTTDEEFQSTSIPSTVGPSSIGCAVAESMAALTNDTDPLPTSSIINAAYNSEFPELLYPNHTVAVPHNELLISDLLMDEDLHFVSLTSNVNEEKHNEDHMDTSSDSVSLTSGQLPSISDYESESRNFSDVPFPHVNCNDQQYYTLKSYYSDMSENCASAMTGGKISFSKKLDYSVPKTPGLSGSFLHHNHSYHLPFSSDEPRYKPITKDKLKYLSEEDACNKDEKRAKELKLPITINDIINLAIDEYNERLSKYELSDAQLTLIRDIRRRGKNKVAAQNCRKRKMDQISTLQQDLGYLQREKLQLKSKQNHLLQEKKLFEDKYRQLYDLVLQSSNSKPPNPPTSIHVLRNRMTIPSNSELLSEDDSDPHRGARTRRKFKK